MHSHYHSKSSVKEWGGVPQDYHPIHEFIDQSKESVADVRHRMILHHTLGTRIAEKVFGVTITNSDGREVPVRLIAEKHIIEDLGFLPTPNDYVKCVSLKAVPWLGGAKQLMRKGKRIDVAIERKVNE